MNIQTITMDKTKAREAFLHYRSSVRARFTKEDHALMVGYRALAKGKILLDLADVMKQAGCNHLYQPKLAICRADATHVWFRRERGGAGTFQMDSGWISGRATMRYVRLLPSTFPWDDVSYNTNPNCDLIKAQVPCVPPQFRPKSDLSNYHVLWEAEWTPEPPSDPILLRRLSGMLFAVMASWDLTAVERAVLRGRL